MFLGNGSFSPALYSILSFTVVSRLIAWGSLQFLGISKKPGRSWELHIKIGTSPNSLHAANNPCITLKDKWLNNTWMAAVCCHSKENRPESSSFMGMGRKNLRKHADMCLHSYPDITVDFENRQDCSLLPNTTWKPRRAIAIWGVKRSQWPCTVQKVFFLQKEREQCREGEISILYPPWL